MCKSENSWICLLDKLWNFCSFQFPYLQMGWKVHVVHGVVLRIKWDNQYRVLGVEPQDANRCHPHLFPMSSVAQ
jgi:hypothetical protein